MPFLLAWYLMKYHLPAWHPFERLVATRPLTFSVMTALVILLGIVAVAVVLAIGGPS